VYVPDKLNEVGLFLADDRFVPVLEKLTASPVATVERDHVSGKEFPHSRGNT
jgi:hypothetical protein